MHIEWVEFQTAVGPTKAPNVVEARHAANELFFFGGAKGNRPGKEGVKSLGGKSPEPATHG